MVDLPGDLDLRRIDARPVLRLQHGGDQAAVILRCLISRGIDEVIRKRDDGMPGRAVADHHGQGEHGRVARTVCDLHTDAVVALGADGQVHERQAHLVRQVAVEHILGLQAVEQGDGAADAVDERLRQGEARLVIIRVVDRPRERAEVRSAVKHGVGRLRAVRARELRDAADNDAVGEVAVAVVRCGQTGAELGVRSIDADLQRNTVRDDAGRGMIGRQAVVQEHGAECNGNGQKQGNQGDL